MVTLENIRDHLNADFHKDFILDGTLNIIDDYNIRRLNKTQEDLFFNAFKEVEGLHTINIYIQNNTDISLTSMSIEEILLAFLFGKSKRVDLKLRDLSKGKTLKEFKPFKEFVNRFGRIGIEVNFYLYSSADLDLPLHGRYWITRSGGYIMDGSLNTVMKKKVLGYIFDDENYNIIKTDFEEHVVPNRQKIDFKSIKQFIDTL